MNEVSAKLDRIEAILSEIERLDKELKGQARQITDREALDSVSRAERKAFLVATPQGRAISGRLGLGHGQKKRETKSKL